MSKATKFKTTREIVFGITDSNKVRTNFTTYPAGTEVYASKNITWKGQFNLRVCGTLMTQVVSKNAFEIAEQAGA